MSTELTFTVSGRTLAELESHAQETVDEFAGRPVARVDWHLDVKPLAQRMGSETPELYEAEVKAVFS